MLNIDQPVINYLTCFTFVYFMAAFLKPSNLQIIHHHKFRQFYHTFLPGLRQDQQLTQVKILEFFDRKDHKIKQYNT